MVGESITLAGMATHFAQRGGGSLMFSAYLGGIEKFSRTVPVTVDSGAGPITGVAQTDFVAEIAGEYTFRLMYSGDADHDAATAADVRLTVGDAPVPPVKKFDELAETGANSPVGGALSALGVALLGAGAILNSAPSPDRALSRAFDSSFIRPGLWVGLR